MTIFFQIWAVEMFIHMDIFERRYFFRKLKDLTPVRFEPSTSGSLFGYYIHWVTRMFHENDYVQFKATGSTDAVSVQLS